MKEIACPCGITFFDTEQQRRLIYERDDARADAARLHEALEGLADQASSLLSELEYQQVSCPLCGEDPGEGEDALCRIVKALGEASSKARALIARLKGETE